VLLAGFAPASTSMTLRAWSMTAGFACIAIALFLPPRRALSPLILAAIMTVFAGFSVVVAIPEPPEKAAERAAHLSKEQVEASTPAAGYITSATPRTFRYAAMITGLGGLAAIFSAYFLSAKLLPGERRARAPGRIERVGKALVSLGFVGVALALIRFAATQFPIEDVWDSAKSFWIGGTYFLFLATFAVPGFGLWVQGMIGRRAARREYLAPLLIAGLYVCLLVPTGQRGFVIALGAILLAILVGNRFISLPQLGGIAALAIFLIGLSQAARNEATETGSLSIGGFVERIAPSGWKDLYASQIASFNWTVLVAANRDQLDIGNSFVDSLAKPVPRSIYPDKSQGFGTEFTERVYPGAAEQQVSFATPLFSEVDYNFGVLGVIVVFLLLGGLCAFAERRFADRAPPAVAPLVIITIAWVSFVLVRGDFSNAIVFGSAWVVPLILFSRALGLREDPEIKRIVVDALQVAPAFSGIGRRLAEIGRGLGEADLGLEIEVLCARDVAERLKSDFPAGTRFVTPLASSRPRWRRILYQQLLQPFNQRASAILLSPGDQAPIWGSSPLIFIIHDVRRLSRPETAASGLEERYYRHVMRSGARRARQIITISEFSKSEIERVLKPACDIWIVNEQLGTTNGARPQADPNGEYLFLSVGAVRSYKGLQTVIDALAALPPDHRHRVRVVHVGAAETEEQLPEELVEAARRAGVIESFEMVGWLSDSELHELRQRAVATVNPSQYEGYGLTVAESLAAGIPTLASDIPPHREIAADAALYFPPNDAESLSRLIARFVAEPELRDRMAAEALRRHQELKENESTWRSVLKQTVETLCR
jgi:glycosyltransferase involved in cell wall biosynthesis